MAIKKTTWTKLIQRNSEFSAEKALLSSTAITSQLSAIDNAIQGKGMVGYISALHTTMLDRYINQSANEIWKDLPIYISTYKEHDFRIWYLLADSLTRYLAFYLKILTDDGFARRFIYDRSFTNRSNTSQTNKGYNSETPQIALQNFDEAINYASSLNKEEQVASGGQAGTSQDVHTGKTFDEAIKNARLIFFNDLADWIAKIPNMVYKYYALDSMPVTGVIIESREYLRGLFETEKEFVE